MKVDTAAALFHPNAPYTMLLRGCYVKDDGLDDDLDIDLSSPDVGAVLVGKDIPQRFGSAWCFKESTASCRLLSGSLE